MTPIGKKSRLLLLGVLLILLAPSSVLAYIGPGTGFALAGSFLAVFAAVMSAIVTLVTWPIRLIVRTLFGLRALVIALLPPYHFVVVGSR